MWGDSMKEAIAKNIKRLRSSNGLTQADLAELCCVTPLCISRWEIGAWLPNEKNRQLLAKAFGISVRDLYNLGSDALPEALFQEAIEEIKSLSPNECKFILETIRQLKSIRNN